MPQARSAHQPHRASNRVKAPHVPSASPSQAEMPNVIQAATNKATAQSPRANRPLRANVGLEESFHDLVLLSDRCRVSGIEPKCGEVLRDGWARSEARTAGCSGEQPPEAPAVIALDKNAGQVCRKGVSDHDQVSPPGVPEEEERGAGQGDPVTEFAPPGFANEPPQVVGVRVGQRSFGKTSAKPARRIGQQVLPSLDAEDAFINPPPRLPRARSGRVKPRLRHARERPGQTKLNDRPAGHVQHDDPRNGQFNRHGFRVLSNGPFCLTASPTGQIPQRRKPAAPGRAALRTSEKLPPAG